MKKEFHEHEKWMVLLISFDAIVGLIKVDVFV